MLIDFLWHLRGSVALTTGAVPDASFAGLQRLLKKQRKPITKRSSDELAFDDPLWQSAFSPNWLSMALYDRGLFWVERNPNGARIRYDLRSFHGLVLCLFFATIAFGAGLLADGLLFALKLGGGAFAWLYGMNVLIALVRVPIAIHRAIRDI